MQWCRYTINSWSIGLTGPDVIRLGELNKNWEISGKMYTVLKAQNSMLPLNKVFHEIQFKFSILSSL